MRLSGVAGMLWTLLMLADPSFCQGRSQAHQARGRSLGGASSEWRARHARPRRWLRQELAHEAVGTWWLGPGCAERRYEGH